MRNKHFIAALFGGLLLFSSGLPVAAQQPSPDGSIVADATLSTEDEYLKPSVQNLSKLYWAIGKLDLSDNSQVDNYLLINECDLYRQYYHNDLEWEKIRTTVRKEISQGLASLPTRFEVFIPIYLDRYDQGKQAFELKEESKLFNVRKLDVNYNSMKRVCGVGDEIPDYPRNIILLLNRPFRFSEIPMKPELADLYINYTMKEYGDLPPELRLNDYKRIAYLRLKVHVTQYKETILLDSRYARAMVFAKLEGLEVYADRAEMKLLYSEKIEDKIRRRATEARDQALPPATDTVSDPAPPAVAAQP